MPVKGNTSSRTTSAVAAGTIDIRENPTQDISALSRDTENALNELGRIFDKKKIEEQQELAAVFGEEAFRLAHNMKDDGSGRKMIVHAAIAGLMSRITGAGFTSGAVAGALNEALINSLKGLDPGTAQIVSAIIGAAAAKVAGGSAAAGASAAAAGTKWNYLLEWQYRRMQEELSKAATEEEKKAILERWAEVDKTQEDRMRQDMRKDEYVIRSTDSEEVTHQKEKNFAALYGDSHYSLERETGHILPDTVVTPHKDITFEEFAAVAHEGLDWAGYVPGFGSAAGAAETVLYLAEGNYSAAILSAATIIPGAKYIKAAKKLADVPGISRLTRTEKNVPSRLPNTHGKAENALDQGQKSRAEKFRDEIKDLPVGEKQARILIEMESLAKEKGWERAKVFSNKSRRVYLDKKEGCYYSVDTQHGTLEKLNRRGQHLGQYNIDLQLIDPPDKSGGHNLKR